MDWKDVLAQINVEKENDAPTAQPMQKANVESEPDFINLLRKAKMQYERKGRGGKQVTILYEIPCDETTLKSLAAMLKRKFATGGSVRASEILLQGDYRSKIEELRK